MDSNQINKKHKKYIIYILNSLEDNNIRNDIGLVHRNVSLSNILHYKKRYYLIDFIHADYDYIFSMYSGLITSAMMNRTDDKIVNYILKETQSRLNKRQYNIMISIAMMDLMNEFIKSHKRFETFRKYCERFGHQKIYRITNLTNQDLETELARISENIENLMQFAL
ncbi:hypothetical protein DRQ26_06410 [bacterium]|nr:MAG: hypothetical protein DRQ26_06410 [bacterium]